MSRTLIRLTAIVVACCALHSCAKKELPVPMHNPGNVLTTTVSMEANYKWQIYYNLKTNTVAGKNLKTAWDLGFEATPAGYHIILNAAKMMLAMKTGKSDMATVTYKDSTGFATNRRWDSPGGSMDSTAIGAWEGDKNVWLIDRGYNELGAWQGMEKIQLLAVTDSNYTVSFAKVNSADVTTMVIKKDYSYNFAYLSFDSGGRMPIVEPPKADWDIAFTQYTHIFYDPVMPYLVTGCLLNRYNTQAYIDTSAFAGINYGNVKSTLFQAAINTIGYDWKTYTGSTYVTNTKINYVIKDKEGKYYKMHFIDFYNTSGVKGNPKWEYQVL